MSYREELNGPQCEAVEHTEGPLLILAGAGSGKTRVLTYRIAYLINEKEVKPWNIMAITFTNKAAGEMRDRVNRMIGFGAEQIWVSTFHSSCARILRRYIDRIGYDTNFTIYDTDDSKQVMKEVIRKLELNPKVYKERRLLSQISSLKNEMIGPDEYERSVTRWEEKNVAKAYHLYQETLKSNNALDFDDLLLKTVELFKQDAEVLDYYQERFRYIMVDEYQDTNTVQFAFVQLLSEKYKNICVVGDDDQSIYKFRGANIRNILEFEYVFKDTKVVKLEQNYRSTQNILNAANAVIHNNLGRKEKSLWSDKGDGDKVAFRQFMTGFEEAEYVAGEISRRVGEGGASYNDFAVLYRTNAQSRLFEEKFVTANVPYKIVGGINFYARKEIKDLLAYLKTIDNGLDDLATQRIINVPKRGIGQTSINKVNDYAIANGISFYDALLKVEEVPGLARAKAKIQSFTIFIEGLKEISDAVTVPMILNQIIQATGYVEELEAEDTPESRARIENIDELINKATIYNDTTENPSLSEFLQQVSLVADIDSVDENAEQVLLMTLHSAKGLEFENVYLTGMEDGTFPSFMSIDDEDELEEERRLCYVGITRAKQHLEVTSAAQRMIRGEVNYLKTSRFVKEIPREYIELDRETERNQRDETYRSSRTERALDRVGFMGALGVDGEGYGSYGNNRSFGGGSYGSGYSSSGSTLGRGKSGRAKKPEKFNLRDFKVSKPASLDYSEGDQVRHVKFGVGTVRNIKDGGKDYEVTVEFENYGVKKMFASFAKLKKI